MPRGGYREGGGRPPSFQHMPTRTIRVPVVLADDVMHLAQKLDRGEISVNGTISKKDQVLEILTEALSLKANTGGAIKQKVREAITLLKY